KALFVGEMVCEENEVSWILHGSYQGLWSAYPQLTHLQIRGASELVLGNINHQNLQTLIIESGGLSSKNLSQVANATLPALTRLDLWLGDEGYGWDGSVEDIKPMTSKANFPGLTHLALCNSEIQDEVTRALCEGDIVSQLITLDLSKGVMSDVGGQLILDNAVKLANVELDLTDNFLSDEMSDKLAASGLNANVNDQEEPDEDDGEICRYVSVSE
ncbi:MAG: hypothetical protein MJK04_30480, partial [Psychrosphaera sp.]|nr:hypothetical protein [Psychrosphaera sp.]